MIHSIGAIVLLLFGGIWDEIRMPVKGTLYNSHPDPRVERICQENAKFYKERVEAARKGEEMILFVCSHMRCVIHTKAGWKHLNHEGGPEVGPPCEAGVYKVPMDDKAVASEMTIGAVVDNGVSAQS